MKCRYCTKEASYFTPVFKGGLCKRHVVSYRLLLVGFILGLFVLIISVITISIPSDPPSNPLPESESKPESQPEPTNETPPQNHTSIGEGFPSYPPVVSPDPEPTSTKEPVKEPSDNPKEEPAIEHSSPKPEPDNGGSTLVESDSDLTPSSEPKSPIKDIIKTGV